MKVDTASRCPFNVNVSGRIVPNKIGRPVSCARLLHLALMISCAVAHPGPKTSPGGPQGARCRCIVYPHSSDSLVVSVVMGTNSDSCDDQPFVVVPHTSKVSAVNRTRRETAGITACARFPEANHELAINTDPHTNFCGCSIPIAGLHAHLPPAANNLKHNTHAEHLFPVSLRCGLFYSAIEIFSDTTVLSVAYLDGSVNRSEGRRVKGEAISVQTHHVDRLPWHHAEG